MPAFDYPGVAGSEIDLPKLLKHGVITPEHLHQLAPFIWNPNELFNLNPMN
jgi:hypothetical protein